ncbi:unnamed protein product [Menidia menidia]|uniref:(Atlantic silverside) hypothetical protein n=1 Tax=Menidia menidia TaxID=238744 RepID=A0A8S4BHB8_9TELE|nr:unnamed protein product [Menidia menidia]
MWISQFPAVFEADPLLEQTMGDLCALVRLDGGKTHSQLIDTSGLSPHENVSQAPSPSVKKRKVSLIFDHMEPNEMAAHLSYLEFKNFCNVSVDPEGNISNPKGSQLVHMTLMMHSWVVSSQTFAQRLLTLYPPPPHPPGGHMPGPIIRIREQPPLCLVGAPEDPDLQLHQALSEMTELLSSRSNYSNYRRLYGECKGFKVPILGVHLKDLISLNEALPDYIDKDKINLSKLQHLYSNINDLLAIHSYTPPFEANKDLLHLLTAVAPVKPPVVAEWGSGAAPRLDPDTISKHVKQMVDSVMKNYDQNQDGYISLEEFEKIAANFPFSFCTQETDREGQISREEITSYFMRGMSVCAKLGYNFNDAHNFHEITYKRPTFCDTCGGFLWGVIKQGYHCKDCGINCHRHCRDLEEAFVFPQGEAERGGGPEDAPLWDRSTQTEPGVWTPERRDRRGNGLNSVPHVSPERRVLTPD